jgi:hypothetical protein
MLSHQIVAQYLILLSVICQVSQSYIFLQNYENNPMLNEKEYNALRKRVVESENCNYPLEGFLQYIHYEDESCENPVYKHLIRLNTCSKSHMYEDTWTTLHVLEDKNEGIYAFHLYYYRDPACSEYSETVDPKFFFTPIVSFSSNKCEKFSSIMILPSFTPAPTDLDTYDFTIRVFDNPTFCNKNLLNELIEIIYMKFNVDFYFINSLIHFTSCSSSSDGHALYGKPVDSSSGSYAVSKSTTEEDEPSIELLPENTCKTLHGAELQKDYEYRRILCFKG